MSAFPNFTNVPEHVISRLNERKGSSYVVSRLNAWVRVSSGAGDGLMLYSNPDFGIFRAAGDSKAGSVYGNSTTSGTIGFTWGGGAVNVSGGQGYKPAPIISSIEVDEGEGDLSRKASFSITAYTREQMDTLIKYFLEPGYSIFLEWGWNKANSVKGWNSTLSGATVANFQSFKNINQRRITTGGEYDCYLGFITGGSLSLDGDKWVISVSCHGYTELAAYMTTSETAEDKIDPGSIVIEPAEPFGTTEIEAAMTSEAIGKERFMRMFNDLPDTRKTVRVQNLINTLADESNFINFDPDVAEQINSETDGTFFNFFKSTVNVGGASVTLPTGTKLISDNKFIKFETLMAIINAIGSKGYKLKNGKTIKYSINTSKTYCVAFEHMISVDPTTLFIPNPSTPKFKLAASTLSLEDTTDNSINGIEFPSSTALSESGVMGETITASAKKWGNLNNLYVNFEFAKGILESKQFVMKDALFQILNGMSSAVNGLWDFQIVERELEEGVTELGIVDLNFVSSTDGAISLVIDMIGTNSILIDSQFDLDISGAKMNQIINQRLDESVNEQGKQVPKTLFSGMEDQVLTQIDKNAPATKDTSQTTPKDVQQTAIDVLLGKVFLYPKVNFKTKDEVKGKPLDDICYLGAYRDTETFSKIKKKELGQPEAKSALMPINFTFKIHGVSGIKRGDMFRVNGLPSVYSQGGSFFQVLSVKHVVDGMVWTTEVTGGWRG
jgi:hypothetical protein